MLRVRKSGIGAWCAASVLVLVSACALEQPASRADSTLEADPAPPVSVRNPDAVRDAREATEQAVQRISELASVAVSAVRELGQEAARSVIGGREGDAVVDGQAETEVEALVDPHENAGVPAQ